MEEKRNSFGGTIGFVLAAAGSAVGLGIPVFSCKRRRRTVYCYLFNPRFDIWLYTSNYRCRNWQKDKAGTAYSIFKTS